MASCGQWTKESTICLGTMAKFDPNAVQSEGDIEKYVELLPRDKFESVTDAVKQLQQNKRYGSDVYAIFSSSRETYYLIYRVGKEAKAREIYGKLKGMQRKAMQIVKPIMKAACGAEPAKVELEEQDLDHLVEMLRFAKARGANEVAIVSIMGTFRQGKSFLLNLLGHYFEWLEEKQQSDSWQPRERDDQYRVVPPNKGGSSAPDAEWFPEEIREHFPVEGTSDSKTCTLGIWLLSQPYLLRKPGSQERVAVLLMDSQGAFDGELETQQSRAILGITAVLASTVLYNVKSFAADTVGHLSDLTYLSEDAVETSFSEFSNTQGRCCFGRMCILVRDKKYRTKDDPAQCPTLADCIEQMKEDTKKFVMPGHVVEPSAQSVVEKLHSSFAQLGVFGLSRPGEAVEEGHSQFPREFNQNFKKLVDEFFRLNFEIDFPVPLKECLSGEAVTAESIKQYLKHLLMAFANCDLKGGSPFLIAYQKSSKALKDFRKFLEERRPEADVFWREDEMDQKKDAAVSKFRDALKNLGLDETSDDLVKELNNNCETAISSRRGVHAAQVQRGQYAVGAVVVGGVGAHFLGLSGLLLAHPLIALGASLGVTYYAYNQHAQQREASIYDSGTLNSFFEVSMQKLINFFRSGAVLGHKLFSRVVPAQPKAQRETSTPFDNAANSFGALASTAVSLHRLS